MAREQATIISLNGAKQEEASEKAPQTQRRTLRQTAIFPEEGKEAFGLSDSHRFVEIAPNDYTNRGKVTEFDTTENRIWDLPLWRSFFCFDESLAPFLKENGALNVSFGGTVALEEMVFDLDSEDNLDLALEDMKNLVRYLVADLSVPAESIRVFFSGGKGYHVHIPNLFGLKPSKTLPYVLKKTIEEEFGFLKTLDTSMLHTSGLIRVPYSVHNKTGFYKQEIPYDDVFNLTAEDTIRRAQAVEVIPAKSWRFNPVLKSLVKSVASPLSSGYHPGTQYSKRVMCMQDLYERGPEVGRRHDHTLRMASWLMRNGVPLQAAVDTIVGWMGAVGNRNDIISTTTSVYRRDLKYGCNDVIMKEHCNPDCIFYGSKAYGESKMVRNAEDLMKGLRQYQRKLASGAGIELGKIFPGMLKYSYRLLPGECMIITGDTGMGKSAFVQNLVVRQYPHHERSVLYLNLEMSEDLTFRRFIQVGHGNLTKNEALDMVGAGYTDQLLDPIKHISMISIAPKVQEVINEVHSNKPDIVVIDTTDAIEVPEAGNNDMYALKVIIEMMRKLAQKEQIIVIGVHHIKKSSSEEGFITLNSLTGNRANVTKMDHVLAITGQQNESKRWLRVLKSRDSEPFHREMEFDGAHMMFRYKPYPEIKSQEDLFNGEENARQEHGVPFRDDSD